MQNQRSIHQEYVKEFFDVIELQVNTFKLHLRRGSNQIKCVFASALQTHNEISMRTHLEKQFFF